MSGPIVITHDDENRCFLAVVDGVEAFTRYAFAEGVATFIRTYIPDAFRGRGIATQLIRVSLTQAREAGWRVTPECPMVATYMKEHPETQDLLTPAGLRLLGLKIDR
ncbi:hypothetical protein EC912_105297 [Luteibacter rhizovicinus]|uniref:Uncharacterized protein n=1 Tax=Luteibacter rhizovicinus TaxID=242606 RepID=A0A4R3YM99_9GAMM|nr:GNAT family N-acetyltransferase [Luteibacter rhizovicinus]TCV93436.1 hypothetical protein EC912_105297 [Luteibacter rhizovicinus]